MPQTLLSSPPSCQSFTPVRAEPPWIITRYRGQKSERRCRPQGGYYKRSGFLPEEEFVRIPMGAKCHLAYVRFGVSADPDPAEDCRGYSGSAPLLMNNATVPC
jgi:hypothetical protein